MVECWQAWRGPPNGLGGHGAGYLPDPGGYMDQPAAMIEAFRIMSAADAALGK